MSQEDKTKQDVIEAVFYDEEHGYGSKKYIEICKRNR